jgi:spore coat polysaccharide biosynthesis protein SpsF
MCELEHSTNQLSEEQSYDTTGRRLITHTVASIQARLGSTRLPGKVLFTLGDRRILEWVKDRTEKAETIDRPVVAIGAQPENDAIQEFCERSNTDHIIDSEENLVSRHQSVVDTTNCDLLVRITGDCPSVPSDEIDRIVEEHKANDARYTTNHTDRMPIGTAVDAIDPDLLADLGSRGETHPVKLARANPAEWEQIVVITNCGMRFQMHILLLILQTTIGPSQMLSTLSVVIRCLCQSGC